jgi:hypothetical protein
MATAVTYVRGAELPPLLVQLLDENNDPISLATASSFTLKLGLDTSTTTVTKTTGITGSASGATVNWVAGELDISSGRYLAELTATIGGLDYRRQFVIQIDDKLA